MADKDSSNSSEEDYPVVIATFVSSSNRIAEMSRGSALSSNPFAIKATCSSGDAKDDEAKPLIAPSTLKLDDSNLSQEQQPMSSSSPRVFLRPSRLAVQAEKFELKNSQDKGVEADQDSLEKDPDSTNGEGKESQLKSNLFSVKIPNVFTSVKDPKSPDSKEGAGGFVFGQNLHERALNYDKNDPDSTGSPMTHDLTFEEAAQKQDDTKDDEQQKEGNDAITKSLSESAKQYESKQLKRKYDEISVITGEEEESNVLQINCKLFEFNKSDKNWQERGKGILRLNDQMCDGVMRSRIVMRTQGNLRVVLNTKVWAGMTVHRASEKTVRLSAIDSDGTRVYLIMARPKDADQLFSALDCRVSTLKSSGESSNGSEKDLSNYENVAFASGVSSTSDLYSFNGSASKRHRATVADDADSSIEFSASGGGEVSSDSVKDSTDDANPC